MHKKGRLLRARPLLRARLYKGMGKYTPFWGHFGQMKLHGPKYPNVVCMPNNASEGPE